MGYFAEKFTISFFFYMKIPSKYLTKIYLFIYPFSKYLLSVFYLARTILGMRDNKLKQMNSLTKRCLYSSEGQKNSKTSNDICYEENDR